MNWLHITADGAMINVDEIRYAKEHGGGQTLLVFKDGAKLVADISIEDFCKAIEEIAQ